MVLSPVHAQMCTFLIAHCLTSMLTMLRLPVSGLVVARQRHDFCVLEALRLLLDRALANRTVLDRWNHWKVAAGARQVWQHHEVAVVVVHTWRTCSQHVIAHVEGRIVRLVIFERLPGFYLRASTVAEVGEITLRVTIGIVVSA